MKKVFLGILIMFLLNFSSRYAWYLAMDAGNEKVTDISFDVNQVLQGVAIAETITGRCRDVVTGEDRNGPTAREWFGCNEVQVYFSDLIYGD